MVCFIWPDLALSSWLLFLFCFLFTGWLDVMHCNTSEEQSGEEWLQSNSSPYHLRTFSAFCFRPLRLFKSGNKCRKWAGLWVVVAVGCPTSPCSSHGQELFGLQHWTCPANHPAIPPPAIQHGSWLGLNALHKDTQIPRNPETARTTQRPSIEYVSCFNTWKLQNAGHGSRLERSWNSFPSLFLNEVSVFHVIASWNALLGQRQLNLLSFKFCRHPDVFAVTGHSWRRCLKHFYCFLVMFM